MKWTAGLRGDPRLQRHSQILCPRKLLKIESLSLNWCSINIRQKQRDICYNICQIKAITTGRGWLSPGSSLTCARSVGRAGKRPCTPTWHDLASSVKSQARSHKLMRGLHGSISTERLGRTVIIDRLNVNSARLQVTRAASPKVE